MTRARLAAVRTWAAFGLAPVLLCLILFALYRSPAFGEHSDPAAWFLTLTFAAAATWLGRRDAGEVLRGLLATLARLGSRGVTGLLAGVMVLLLAVARLVLDAFPNSGDEIAYVMQAQTYALGRLSVALPAAWQSLQLERFYEVNGAWLSQYPPGWALVLTPFAALGAPLWIVNPLLGVLVLVLFHRLARRHVSPAGAWLSVLLLGSSAFYILNAASYFNHILTTLFALAFALAAERFLERGRWRDAVLAGAWIGCLGLTRTQNAAPFVLAFLMVLAARPDRRLGMVGFAMGGAPFLAALAAYNALTTGNPLLPPQYWTGSEPLGEFDLQTLRLTLSRVVRLHEWTSPILLYGSVAAWIALARRRSLGLTDWIAPLTFLMFLVYGGDGGNQYGPRYYFEAWPFAILTLAKVATDLLASPDSRIRDWTASAAVTAMVCQIAYLGPRLEREHRVIIERQSLYRAVASAGITRAIVFIKDEVGTTRPMEPNDLLRNGFDVSARNVIYALPLPGAGAAMMQAYPGRRLYIYRNHRLEPWDGATDR